MSQPIYEELHIKSKFYLPKIPYAFFKYNSYYDEWFVDDNIDKVEFYIDECQDFKENTNNETNN